MTATFQQARDQICAVFKAAWDPRPVVWDDVPSEKPTGVPVWARFTIKHALGQQASLANASGVSRYRRQGLIIAQIFTPCGEGLSQAYTSAKVVTDAFEGTTTAGGVWFRNVGPREVGPDGDWYQTNVLIEFEYDEVK